MIILSLCENPDILRIFKMIKFIINVIKIAVPIILIISLMIDFIKPIISNKDELIVTGTKAVKKMVAAMLVFFVPTLLNIIINIAGTRNIGYANCFTNATNEYIANAYVLQAQKLIEIANKTEDRTDYNKAAASVKALKSNKAVVTVLNDKTDNTKEEEPTNNNTTPAGSSGNGNIHYRIKPATSGKLVLTDNITGLEKELKTVEGKVIKKEEDIKKEREKREQERKANRKTNAKLIAGKSGFAWPLIDNSTITACFCGNDSTHKALGGGHGAIDMACAAGTPVYATKDGRVKYSNYPGTYPPNTGRSTSYIISNCFNLGNGGCANKVQIEHANGVISTYCHLLTNSITVKQGEYVKQGDKIGEVGSTGCSTGNHLHFAIQEGSRRDPLNYVVPFNVPNPNRCNSC